MKILAAIACLLSGTVSLAASTLVIDNFDSYGTTGELQQNWNSFGVAATAGPPVLHLGEGVEGSNAARFALDWRGGNNNANARRINLNNLDLSTYTAITVVAFIETRASFEDPTNATMFKLALEGANGAIWQTPTATAPTIESDSYAPYTFVFSEMELITGSGTVSDALQNIANFRLRFENASGNNSRQDAFMDSVTAVSETPGIEPAQLEIFNLEGSLELRFTTTTEQVYQLQRSADLGEWENVGESIIGSGEPATHIPAIGDEPRQFYRVVISKD